MAAISSPTVSVLPCSERGYGAARPFRDDVEACQPAKQQQGQQRSAAEHDPDTVSRYGPRRRPGRSLAARERPGSHPEQDNKSRQAERCGLNAQGPVRAENGDDAAESSTNLSPSSRSAMSGVRAEENGTPVSTAQNRRHGPGSPSGIGQGLPRPIWPVNILNAPGHLVTPAEVIGCCHRYVIPVSLTVSDAGRLCREYRPESPSDLPTRPSLCWFRCLSPMLGQSPTAG